jgi:hypothetical protein
LSLTRTLVWQGVDAPRMEVAHIGIDGSTLTARGTQIGAGYELRYALAGDRLDLEVVGGLKLSFGLAGADFFDLGFSPLFNSLPVLRDGLLSAGAAQRDYRMQWVAVPELTVELSEQRYEPLGDGRIRFAAGDYRALIEFDADGFVTSYEGLAVRVT